MARAGKTTVSSNDKRDALIALSGAAGGVALALLLRKPAPSPAPPSEELPELPEDLQEVIEDILEDIADLERELAELKAAITRVETLIEAQGQLIEQAKVAVAELRAKVEEAKQILATMEQDIANLEGIIAALETERQSLEAQLGEGVPQLERMAVLLQEAQATIAHLREQLAEAQRIIGELQAIIGVLEDIIADLERNNQALMSELNNIKAIVAQMEATIAKLREDINRLLYLLEPVPVQKSVLARRRYSGLKLITIPYASVPIHLSIDQAINLSGYLYACGGCYPFGCTTAYIRLRDARGRIIKEHILYAYCHGLWHDCLERKPSGPVQLARGSYVLEVGQLRSLGYFQASATVSYKTARVIAERGG